MSAVNAIALGAQTPAPNLEAHIKSCFGNMAFPHLVRQFSSNEQDANAVTGPVFDRLLQEVTKKAIASQKIADPSALIQDKAIAEFPQGKLMRTVITFIHEFMTKLPADYLKMIDHIAQNHLNKIVTPEENLSDVLSSAQNRKPQPSYSQDKACPILVSGAPGVGKSTYSTAAFRAGEFIDTSTDTYSNLLAEMATKKFGIARNEDPYQVGGLEGSLIKRKFIDLLNAKLKNPEEFVPNIVISTVKVYGPELEGIFKSAIPEAKVALIFCSQQTAVSHMKQRATEGLHNAPVNVIQKGLSDASNQLFSNENLMDSYKNKYKSVVHYLRQNCQDHRKTVVVEILSSETPADQSQFIELRKTADGKSFALSAQMIIKPDGSAELKLPSDSILLGQFLAQSGHTLEHLQQQLKQEL